MGWKGLNRLHPRKIHIEPEDDGLEDDFPKFQRCILRFQPLIFRGVSDGVAKRMNIYTLLGNDHISPFQSPILKMMMFRTSRLVG